MLIIDGDKRKLERESMAKQYNQYKGTAEQKEACEVIARKVQEQVQFMSKYDEHGNRRN